MAELLLSQLLNGEINHDVILDAITRNISISSRKTCVALSDFIPHFLSYIREQLTPAVDPRSLYYSPRQIKERKDRTQKKKETNKKTARISLKYASSPSQKCLPDATNNDINSISPIKTTKMVKTTRITSPATISTPKFELSSFEDFPSMTGTPSSKNPRRITATPVSVGDASLHVSKNKISDNVFLLEESSFEAQNADCSLNQLFFDDKRFTKKQINDLNVSVSYERKTNGFDNSFTNDVMSNIRTPTKLHEEMEVKDRVLLNILIDIYSCICLHNHISNHTLELYFLFTTLTCPCDRHYKDQASPFSNVECCIYFAAKCLEKFSHMLVLLDIKSMQLLHDNIRLKKYVNSLCFEQLHHAITDDLNINQKESLVVKSPMTGIPFQVESDNRKSFLSDRHFYSFSKKRDAFYALVREWQEKNLDPDWNVKSFMLSKVPELMKCTDEIYNHYPFARLFVAQLLEMCRNSVGSQADEPNTSDSVLVELKKCNPTKFQSLHERLTRPSASHDLCPQPSFSKVEEFFKEFISIADGYCFSRFLLHVLLSYITDINSNSFGLDGQINNKLNKSDFAESLWQDIKLAIAELRLLSKFLSYVVFLPYNSARNEEALLKSRHLVSEPLDIFAHLRASYVKKRLLITVPWVVDFFSMADTQAFELYEYKRSLNFLVFLLKELKIARADFSLLEFSLILHIGWLLELPHIQNMNFFLESETIETKEIGIDDIVSVDKQFLYTLCPYLSDIKKPLLEFSKGTGASPSGSFRKITPVRASDTFSVDVKSNLKIQLLENFMKYLPTHVKDCMKFVTERHFMNIKHRISSGVITSQFGSVIEKVKEGFKTCEDEDEVTPEKLKSLNHTVYIKCTEQGRKEVETESQIYLQSYLDEKVFASLETLLPESTNSKILEVSSKVVKHNIRLKVQEWMTANKDLYISGVEAAYNRFVMNIIKTSKKEKSLLYNM